MRSYHPVLIACLALFLSISSSYAAKAVDDEKFQVIYELFEATKLQSNMLTITQDLLAKELRKRLQNHPQIQESELQTITEIVQQTFEERSGDVIQPIANLYAKEFTTEELKVILAYQKSPAGQKATRLMPSLFQQGMLFGQKWGQEVGMIAVERIKEHFKKKGIDI